MEYKEKSKINFLYKYVGFDGIEHIRKFTAKTINTIDNIRYRNKFNFLKNIKYDKATFRYFCSGTYGASLHHAISIIKKHTDIKNKTIFIIGCGRGEEIHHWIKQKPKKIVAIDYLDYSEDWKKITYKNVEIRKGDIKDFNSKEKFDIVTSKAVFEHINNLEEEFKHIANLVKKDGFMWADFGPLYYTYKGSHFPLAYDHLRFSKEEFENMAKQTGDELAIEYLDNNLFSKLKYNEYINLFNKFFNKKYLGIEVSEDAIRYRNKNKKIFDELLKKHKEEDLMISSIFYLGKKQNKQDLNIVD